MVFNWPVFFSVCGSVFIVVMVVVVRLTVKILPYNMFMLKIMSIWKAFKILSLGEEKLFSNILSQ